jgi:DNA-binding transcriptional ArsR family regulator
MVSDSALPLTAAAIDPADSSPIQEMDVDAAIAVMTVLAHKLRIEIWCLLAPLGSTGLSAGAIAKRISMAPSTISFHLQQMTKIGALALRQNGRYSIYSVQTAAISDLRKFLAVLIQGQELPSTSATS